ncbi:hypothetical protein [Lactobacillus sp. Sy-1]|uniref:hypothetical protein n=1 Tax=Lactobacillus sp. Sy-1 TaxID=2109645 RepID=UPI001C585826|nr:hypothetical protein [Lactobacillus sp. Sy-1]MBW1604824.1 hypothetical protein [Lactobacillus sp. Sy-1]
MKSIENKFQWRHGLPYLFILVIACLALYQQWHAQSAYIGLDSLFHMNRFYDAMMQIKTGNYSYFQSFFGFGQSGRVVNAVYGPLFAYFNGLLLLVTKNWVNYQIVSSILLFIISGSLMYHLAVKNRVDRLWALVISVCYMFSTPLLYWINGQQFTAWGAAFVPLLMLCGTNMMNEERIAWIKLALSMTLVLQIHNVTSVISALALIPFFMVGLFKSSNRRKMILDLFKAIGLTLLLSFNVWGGMLELFSSNHLLPVAPDLHLAADSLYFIHGATRLEYSALLMFILAVLYLVVRWRHISLSTRVIILNGLFFLWIPSHYFPWKLVANLLPAIDSVIQNPIRFLVIPYTLLYLAVGLLLSDRSIKWFRYILAAITILIMFNEVWKDVQHVKWKNHRFNSDIVLMSNRFTVVNTKDPDKLRAATRSDNPQKILKLATKSTSDYLPVKKKISVYDFSNFSPYYKYRSQIINPGLDANNQVKNGLMTVKWTNSSSRVKNHQLSVVKYAHSIVTLNGKRLNNVKLTSIGAIIVKGKPGVNRLTIKYSPALWFSSLLMVSIITWIILIGDGIRRLISKK